MNLLKQIFCDHFWKDTTYEVLRNRILAVGGHTISRIQYVAQKQECIKCGAIQVIEMRLENE